MLLAEHPRLRRALVVAIALGLAGGAYAIRGTCRPAAQHTTCRAPALAPSRVVSVALLEAPAAPPRATAVDEEALILATLREPPVRTGRVIESDWARRYRGEGEGPIHTWTTMRGIDVPSLNHRMFAEVRPLLGVKVTDDDIERGVIVEVRAVVAGDADAALARVRANPEVERADLWLVRGGSWRRADARAAP